MLGNISGYFYFSTIVLLVVMCGAFCHPLAENTGINTNETNISYMCDHFDEMHNNENSQNNITNMEKSSLDKII